MNLIRRTQSFIEIRRAFEIVYGRKARKNELPFLVNLSKLGIKDKSRIFRAVIGGYDHQVLKTPFTVRFSEKDIEFISISGSSLAIDSVDVSVSMPNAKGDYEPHMKAFYLERLKPGMTFIDVGVNIGLYSILGAQLVGSTGKVISFEPNSENCRLILYSVNRNKFKNISLFPLALSNKTGHTFFSTFIGSNGGLLPNNESVLADPNCIFIPTIKLDDLIDERVDFIKIDVEGAEGLVVSGAKRNIEKYRPLVTSEFSMEMLPRVSGMSGYEYLTYFKNNAYDIFMIDSKSKGLLEIPDIRSFIDSYGSPGRIEDLAFIPRR
jgi:FkbM family methyltransferase